MTKVSMKERIAEVLGGLVLLLAGYMLLTLINPNLVVLDQKLANVEYVNYEGAQGYEAVALNPHYDIPEDPRAQVVYYVPVDEDGNPLFNQQYRSREDCERAHSEATCTKKTMDPVEPTGDAGALVEVTTAELHNYGGLPESNPKMCERIQQYAQWVGWGGPWPCTSEPWSAIFISYMMHLAGKTNFPKSAGHWVYINAAFAGHGGMRAHRWGERVAQPGDLICAARGSSVGSINYDTAPGAGGGYPSHCSIVIANNGDAVIGVGGNVSNTVKREIYPAINGKPVLTNKSIAIISIP